MTEVIDTGVLNEKENRDSVKIADDVVKCIAALALDDIEGVAGMAGNPTGDIIAMFGGRNLEKGVKMSMDEDGVRFVLSVIIQHGYSIPEVSRKIQDKVRSTVENMTGFNVCEVAVNVSGIDIPAEEE